MSLEKYKSVGVRRNDNQYIHIYECKECKDIKKAVYPRKNLMHSFLCKKCANLFVNRRGVYSNKHCYRPIKLINIITGEIGIADSITFFCQKHPELGKYAKHHFSEVLRGTRLHFKGWMLEKNYNKIDRTKVSGYCSVFTRGALK